MFVLSLVLKITDDARSAKLVSDHLSDGSTALSLVAVNQPHRCQDQRNVGPLHLIYFSFASYDRHMQEL